MNKKLAGAIVILAGAFCLLVSPAPAVAQGNTWVGANLAQMVEAAGWRLGLMRINAAFTLANAGYDSDVYYGYYDEPVPDWTLTAGLPVQVLVPLGKKVVLDFSDTPQYLFYLDTERERAWNNAFQGKIYFALDRVFIQAGGGMSDVRRRHSPELDINVREKRSSLEGLFLWQASKATSFALDYGWTRYGYGDEEYLGSPISGMLDREEHSIDFVTYVQPSSRTRLFLDGQYVAFGFTGGTSSIGDARSYGVYGGLEFIPRVGELAGSTGIRGGFRLGYVRLDISDPLYADGSGFAGSADISVDLTRKTSLRGFFSRGFQFSVYAGATYYMSTSYGAGLAQRLSRKATLSYDISLGRTSYPEEGEIQGVRDRYTAHGLSLRLRLARHLDMALQGTLSRREREAAELPLDRNFFGLSLTYGFSGSGMSSPGGRPGG